MVYKFPTTLLLGALLKAIELSNFCKNSFQILCQYYFFEKIVNSRCKVWKNRKTQRQKILSFSCLFRAHALCRNEIRKEKLQKKILPPPPFSVGRSVLYTHGNGATG